MSLASYIVGLILKCAAYDPRTLGADFSEDSSQVTESENRITSHDLIGVSAQPNAKSFDELPIFLLEYRRNDKGAMRAGTSLSIASRRFFLPVYVGWANVFVMFVMECCPAPSAMIEIS